MPDSIGMATAAVAEVVWSWDGDELWPNRPVLQRRGGSAVKCGRTTADSVDVAGGDEDEGKVRRRRAAEWDLSDLEAAVARRWCGCRT